MKEGGRKRKGNNKHKSKEYSIWNIGKISDSGSKFKQRENHGTLFVMKNLIRKWVQGTKSTVIR